MGATYKNKNRGYQQLRVWEEAQEQISQTDFDPLDGLAFKLENGLLKLVEALEKKQMGGDWIDHLVVKESNSAYTTE